MKSKRTAPLSAVMLRATACASENGCFDYVSNGERGTAPWEDMQKRLEKQGLAHAEGKEGQKPPCTLPLTAACYHGDHVPCTNLDAILHLLTSSIFFSSFFPPILTLYTNNLCSSSRYPTLLAKLIPHFPVPQPIRRSFASLSSSSIDLILFLDSFLLKYSWVRDFCQSESEYVLSAYISRKGKLKGARYCLCN